MAAKDHLYKETIGKATIQIRESGNDWIVSMVDDGKSYEMTFHASPYPDKQPYDLAIKVYDNTVTVLQKKYGTSETLDKPNFILAVKKGKSK